MKLTREKVRAIEVGKTLELECTPNEMMSARTVISQVALLDDKRFTASYNRNTHILTIKHITNYE